MILATRSWLLLIVWCILLAGCSTTRLANSWKDPKFSGPPLTNLLVIGVSRSEANRRIFEDTFSQRLHAAGIKAAASYTLIPESGEIPHDRVEEAVARVGADGVLVTRVQRVEQRVGVDVKS